MFARLLPRQTSLFDLFERHATLTVAGTNEPVSLVPTAANIGRKAGIPVSTTHTTTGSIMGVGATTGLSAVRRGRAGRLVAAWISTIPAAGLVAAACFYTADWARCA
jgi:hypothetical protein